ncbi:MAG: hypothetical protein K2Z80_15475 [Xanthobacteraceae bacterium]|nr:hypothetical protein [Xanthobacteraceae bacterium]
MLALRHPTTGSGAIFKAVNAGLAVGFSLGIVLSMTSWSSVVEQAKATANNKPFCIQVADNGQPSYRPADTLLDLSGLTLRSKFEVQHHAILVVGDGEDPQFFHWSYRKQEFVPGVINQRVAEYGPGVTCIPRRDFADGLPMLFRQTSADRYVRLSRQHTFHIPAAYQPRWSSRSLWIAAPAPDFAPLKTAWDRLSARERDSNWVFVQWNSDWLLGLMASTDGQAAEQETAFGLQKQLIVQRGRDSKDYESHRYIAPADRPASGANPTLITCPPPSGQMLKSCQHRFLHGSRHYYFRHRPEDVPRWQEMQKKVLDLFASFEVRNAEHSDR